MRYFCVTTMICNYKASGHQQAQIVVLHFLKKASVKMMTCIIVSEKGRELRLMSDMKGEILYSQPCKKIATSNHLWLVFKFPADNE